MTLDRHVCHAIGRSYVVKLHRDACAHESQLIGRLESMTSGVHYDFHSGAELLACLIRELAQTSTVQGRNSTVAMDPANNPPQQKNQGDV